jgi:putative transposase
LGGETPDARSIRLTEGKPPGRRLPYYGFITNGQEIMPFWNCYYHIIWTTKYRQAIITPVIETVVLAALEQKCEELRCKFLIGNTVADHIHLALSIPPARSVAELIGNLKGASSRAVNLTAGAEERFRWEESYGVLTFGERSLPVICDYIARQKQHHKDGTLNKYFERFD